MSYDKFRKLFSWLEKKPPISRDSEPENRRHTRCSADFCMAVIGDDVALVKDWCEGGALMDLKDKPALERGQSIDVTMSIKLQDGMVDFTHQGRVVRAADGMLAIAFDPVQGTMKRLFQKIRDDFMAQEFAMSQMSA